MKIQSKILCYLLMVTILLPQFLIAQPKKANAVSPPQPTNPCSELPNTTSGISSSTNIVCDINGRTLTFSYNGKEGNSSLGSWFGSNHLYIYDLQKAATNSLGIIYNIAVSIDSATGNKKIAAVALMESLAEGPHFELIDGTAHTFYRLDPIPPPIIRTDSDSLKQTKTDLANKYKDPSNQEEAIKDLRALQFLNDRVKATNGLGVVPFSVTFNPLTLLTTACGDYAIQPISSTGTGIQDLFKTMSDAMKASLDGASGLDPAKKQAAIKKIDDTFSNPSAFLSTAKDQELFKTFYSTDLNGGAPNIRPDGTTYKKFANMTTDVNIKMPLGYSLSQYLGAVGPLMSGKSGSAIGKGGLAVGGLAALFGSVALAVSATAVGGAAVGTTIGDNINNWTQGKELEAMLQAMVPVIVAYYYLKSNINFNKCASLLVPPDPAAFYDSTIEAELDNLFYGMSNLANAFATNVGEGQTACDKIDGNFIMAGIAQAICGFTILFKKWANSFICIAEGYLEASLGIKSGGSSIPTGTTDDPTRTTESVCANQNYNDQITGQPGGSSATATPGTPTSPGNDINQQAVTICTASKLAMDPITWNTGPCLSENLNGSGKAVDLVHVPTAGIDNTLVCTNKTNLIKLNVNDCSVVP